MAQISSPRAAKIDVGEVARQLGVKRQTVYSWVHKRQIPFYKIGGLVRFDQREIDEWLATKKSIVFRSKNLIAA